MKIMKRFTLVMAWIACAGMISPISVFGGQPAQQQSRIQDIALNSGALAGQVVDQQGNAIAGTAVAVGQDGRPVSKAVTDEYGRFEITNLTGGVYHVASAGTVSVCRVWSEAAAPPVATDGLLVVSNNHVIRGQAPCNTCNTGGYAAGPPADGGYVVNGPVDGGYVDGGACGPVCCPEPYGGGGGGALGFISNPWFVGAAIAAAIAIPIAVSNSDDDDDAS
jgi:hypothetical protein